MVVLLRLRLLNSDREQMITAKSKLGLPEKVRLQVESKIDNGVEKFKCLGNLSV